MDAITSKLSDEQLEKRLSELNGKILELQAEQKQLVKEKRYLELKNHLKSNGYLITVDDIDVNDNEIVVGGISLPVQLSLRTIGNPQDNEEDAEIDYYDDDRMPEWCRYLNYPEAETATDFESCSDWCQASSGWDSPYSARGTCSFHIYGLLSQG